MLRKQFERKYSDGALLELGGVLVAHPLPVLVEAIEQPRRPSAVPFEQTDAQVREPLEHPAGGDAHGHGHDPDRLPEGVPHHEVVELEGVVGPQVVLTAAVEAHRHAELLARAPDRVVGGIVPRPPVDEPGQHEDRLKAERLDAAPHLVDGGVDIVRREETGAQQAWALAAVVGHPVVVGTGDRRREPGFEPISTDVVGRVEPEDEEPTAREQHRDVDTLLVHGRELRRAGPTGAIPTCASASSEPGFQPTVSAKLGFARPMRVRLWSLTRTRMSRWSSLSPTGAA